MGAGIGSLGTMVVFLTAVAGRDVSRGPAASAAGTAFARPAKALAMRAA
jgi:hypothetical protein